LWEFGDHVLHYFDDICGNLGACDYLYFHCGLLPDVKKILSCARFNNFYGVYFVIALDRRIKPSKKSSPMKVAHICTNRPAATQARILFFLARQQSDHYAVDHAFHNFSPKVVRIENKKTRSRPLACNETVAVSGLGCAS